jgi:hypothetical protein
VPERASECIVLYASRCPDNVGFSRLNSGFVRACVCVCVCDRFFFSFSSLFATIHIAHFFLDIFVDAFQEYNQRKPKIIKCTIIVWVSSLSALQCDLT